MTEKFRATEATEWNSHGNIGRGKVRRKLTTRTLLKGNAVATDGLEDDAQDEPAPEARSGDSPSGAASERDA
jgi:hypothetical protein